MVLFEATTQRRCMLVFAHPDDESVGLGGLLAELRDPRFVCITNGSPHDLADARRAGCATREAYATLRQAELRAAVATAGHAAAHLVCLGVEDQRASHHLVGITRAIEACLEAFRPVIVVTHPYEGGHPDHDATAFAVHQAIRRRGQRGEPRPEIVEMTSYHDREGEIVFADFLPDRSRLASQRVLDAAGRARKFRLLACHASQMWMLRHLSLEYERLRIAPDYDFTQPPHAGALLYERFPWGMTGERFRSLVADAIAQLDVPSEAATERAACR